MKNPTFIETYDNVLSKNQCKQLIDLFPRFVKKHTDEDRNNIDHTATFVFDKKIEDYLIKIVNRYKDEYVKKYHMNLSIYDKLNPCIPIKIQKTSPGEGYHVWHHEYALLQEDTQKRVLVFIIYLNDIDAGGETEFLYQNQRVVPKTGKLVIWPAYFTHQHRGNPPLENDKYVLTGWISN